MSGTERPVTEVGAEPEVVSEPGSGGPGRPRLGWLELGVAAAAYLLLSIGAGIGLYAVAGPELPVVPLLALTGVATLAAVAVALALRVRSLTAIGLNRCSARWLLLGVGAGIVAFLVNRLVILGWFWATGDTTNPQQALGDAAASGALVLTGVLLTGAVLVPFAEELLFRGIGYGALRRYGVLVAAVASSLIFGLAHGVSVVLPAAIVLGLIAAVLYERSGSIWPAVVTHAVNNAIVFGLAAVFL